MYLKLENSGFLVRGDENTSNLDDFGVLTNNIELSYSSKNKIISFKCD